MVIIVLQKLFLCLNNFYMMYVKYLDGLFGKNLQSVRSSKIWTSKLKSGGFVDNSGFFESIGVLRVCSSLFYLANDLFIYRQEFFKTRVDHILQDHMLWLGWIVHEASLKIIFPMLCTLLHRVVGNLSMLV